jgi:dTDP-4-amino-4,6-dideoxy-D-glucose/dTDP-4-amino-2,4-dideoxy-beta-L-xylose transaminase
LSTERVPLFKVHMSPEAAPAVAEVLASGYCGQGPKVDAFELAVQRELGFPRRLIATNSCTSALDMAYELCGIKEGDFVVSTPVTCTATNAPLANRGARILWADVNPDTGLIDHADVEHLCSEHDVKAIVAVDWAGAVCDYWNLKDIGPPVVEDSAHLYLPGAFGNQMHHGDYVAHSFQAIKALTTGDGGSLYVPRRDEKLAELLRWYGLDRKSSASFRCAQTAPVAGFKYHMNDIAAAIGLANIETARAGVKAHQECAEYYGRELEGIKWIGLPSMKEPSAHWIYCVLVSDQDGFIRHLDALGIDASPVHARNDKHPALRGWKWRRLPGVDDFCSREVAIPCGWWLSSDDRRRVVEGVRSWSK